MSTSNPVVQTLLKAVLQIDRKYIHVAKGIQNKTKLKEVIVTQTQSLTMSKNNKRKRTIK